MNILLIISPFNPAQTPNTLRWNSIINQLTEKGHQLYVLTSQWTGEPKVKTEDGVTTHRTGHHTLLDAFYNLMRIKNRRNAAFYQKPKSSSRLRKCLEFVIDKTWRNVYWPDGSMLFRKPGTNYGLALIEKHNISHVISVGIPYTNHLVAMSLKRKFPHLIWLMDIQDVFSFSDEFRVNNLKLYSKKNIDSEAEAFKLADKIVVTNINAKKRYDKLFHNNSQKLSVIPPLFEKIQTESISTHNPNCIDISYFGNFYEGVRSPLDFFSFLRSLKQQDASFLMKLRIHLYGDHSSFVVNIFNQFPDLHQHVFLMPMIKRQEIFTKTQSIDFLLNFGNTTDYHLPSKLVDFIYFQIPVINVCHSENDLSFQFLNQKVEMMNLILNEDHYGSMFEKFIEFISQKRSKRPINENLVTEYLPENITHQYLQLLQP